MRMICFGAFSRSVFLIGLAMLAPGCSNAKPVGDSQQANTTAASSGSPSFSFPGGLAVNSSRYVEGRQVDGVYPGSVTPDPACCWLAAKATVTVDRQGSSKNLAFVVYVPDIGYFHSHAESVSIKIGARNYHFSGLTPGVHNLPVQLDQNVPDGRVVAMISGDPWIPAKTGVNADTRTLSVILNSVQIR